MAYTYLLNLYEIIDKRIAEINNEIDTCVTDLDQKKYLEGKVAVLSELKEFLILNLNQKLPKRLRNRLKGSTLSKP